MKLFVFDVDGTILENYKIIRKSTIDTINSILDRGDAIAIASGRPFNGVKRYLKKFHNGKKFAICANGACLCDYEGNTYYENTIPFNLFLDIRDKYIDQVGKLGDIYCYIRHDLGYFKKSFYVRSEAHLNKMRKINLNKIKINDDEELYKIMLAASEEFLDKIKLDEAIYKKYHVVKSAPYFLEIMNKNSDKSSGVKALADLLKIPYSNVYTFGDEDNDYLMIKNFNGIAMGNAIEKVKEVAKFITKPVNEDGVSYAINYLINKKED